MSGFIPYGRQQISDEDIEAVVRVLRSDYLTQGPAIPAFEQAVARYCGARYAVAVNSATSALHIACLALGLGPGKRVWTSPNTFVASANCGIYCGAEVDFVDIDFATGNMSVEALAEKLERSAKQGFLPDVVIPVHFAGQPCEMSAIRALADNYGFRIVEDASHAIGARYADEKYVGNCWYADITVFSFHPVKIITTGEGGIALTNSPELAATMNRLRSHGITRDPAEMEGGSDGNWYYQQIELGFNYRITDIQAALGLSQLQRLGDVVTRRTERVARYERLLADVPVGLPELRAPAESAWHLYVVHVPALARRSIFDAMRASEIGVNVHYIPVHLQPYYRRRGFKPGDFPEAERHYASALSLPLFPALTDAEQDHVVSILSRAMEVAA